MVTDNPALTHPVLVPVVDAGAEDLTQRGYRGSEHVARTVLARVAWQAYQAGRRDAVAELQTTQQVADTLGIDPSRVRRMAATRGLGWQISSRERLFRPEDVEEMRTRTPGRPRRET